MAKIFKIPFAATGDKISPPDAVQSDGSVSYSQGYGFDYQRPTDGSDPLAKDFPRQQHNGVLNDITEALGQVQINGFSLWSVDGAPYPMNAFVRHSEAVWRSTVINNNTTPGAIGASWVDASSQPSASETVAGIIAIATQAETNTGTDDGKAITAKKLKAWGASQIAQASELVSGIAKIATQALTDAGADDQTIITPKKLRWGLAISLTANGYIKLPTWLGGVILQWGTASTTSSSAVVVYPLAFPNGLLMPPVMSSRSTSVQWLTWTTTAISNLGFTAGCGVSYSNGSFGNGTFSWFAVGY